MAKFLKDLVKKHRERVSRTSFDRAILESSGTMREELLIMRERLL